MLQQMNDIHQTYIRSVNGQPALMLDERYSYRFINIESSGALSPGFRSYSPYFFVFAIEKKKPFSTFVNIIPSNYLDAIQITMHSSIHFHYLNIFHFRGNNTRSIKINDQIRIQYDEIKKLFTAIIKDQTYVNLNSTNTITAKQIRYDLFSKKNDCVNGGILYNKNFEVQKNFLDQKRILENNQSTDDDFFVEEIAILNYLQDELDKVTQDYPQPVSAYI